MEEIFKYSIRVLIWKQMYSLPYVSLSSQTVEGKALTHAYTTKGLMGKYMLQMCTHPKSLCCAEMRILHADCWRLLCFLCFVVWVPPSQNINICNNYATIPDMQWSRSLNQALCGRSSPTGTVELRKQTMGSDGGLQSTVLLLQETFWN